MLINDTYFSEIAFIQNNNSINLILQVLFCAALIFSFYSTSFAQWVSDHNSNVKFVTDTAGSVNRDFKNIRSRIKRTRNRKNGIYRNKIADTKTDVLQLPDFKSGLLGDSVKLSWRASNQQSKTVYNIQRTVQSDTGTIPWKIIATIKPHKKISSKYYEYFDEPDISGTLYYRITEANSSGGMQVSETEKINYFGNSVEAAVGQNNPNPFSDSTTISFFLPDSNEVTFDFFNDHVELINEIKKKFPAGDNKITFSAEGLDPGIYFYRMQVDDFIDVKKMVITK